MSPCETGLSGRGVAADLALTELVDALSARLQLLDAGDATDEVDFERVRTLMGAAIRVFVAARARRADLDAIGDEISPTDVMTTASALLEHYELSLFDMAAWSHREPPKGM